MNFRPALLLMLALAGPAKAAHPFEDATYEAMKLCWAAGAINLESCGDSTVSSPAHSAARKAVIRWYMSRAAFMRACQATERYVDDCPYMADWHFWRGFNRAVNEEQTATAIK